MGLILNKILTNGTGGGGRGGGLYTSWFNFAFDTEKMIRILKSIYEWIWACFFLVSKGDLKKTSFVIINKSCSI